ncbi:MAG: penicillin-binding transpeptidase domain-containing protein, partial [Thermodesulfobacteriota bacterium]
MENQDKRRSRRDILSTLMVFPALLITIIACGIWWTGYRHINGEGRGEEGTLPPSHPYSGQENLVSIPEREESKSPGGAGFDLSITLPIFQEISNGKYVQRVNGKTLIYTVLPELQQKIFHVAKTYRFPSCSIVALDPSTGRVLALVDYSRTNPHVNGVFKGGSYAAASIFKLITAAGVLEEGLLGPESLVRSYGNPYRLHRRKIERKRRYRLRRTTFKRALARSDNVAFAIVTSDILGWERLKSVAERFK